MLFSTGELLKERTYLRIHMEEFPGGIICLEIDQV